ncbi:DNA-directed RNA polymerases IV and V subunit 2-like isoform X1 [Phalaenopsis equestris]|uniref:DNA-directed RNA polymerases IV and V subunit 2-like isoform X1 n=1 Tax=Phalaenopsis equestris TaxID=78828 RepID=UPI0009E437C4|nr:DNA-directed RNA polymerases IV and V subunit 2-like isoform X1 [Phalaenopsis equestris]
MEVESPATPVVDVSAEPAALTDEEGQSLDVLDVEADSILENNLKGKDHSYDSMSVDSPIEHDEQLDMSLEMLEKFFKGASRAFFNEYGLVSHQINSYNEFIKNGLQELFDSLGAVAVEPDYNPQDAKNDGSWKHATVTFGKVRLEKPVFWVEKNDLDEQELKLTPKHARLQNMTYSAQMKVKVRVQVYVHRVSDKAKTGQDAGVHKMLVDDKESEIVLGRLPVMVRSDLCWLPSQDKNDCFFDPGGYFLIKGMEKTFIAQEQRCLTRLWITDKPCWTVQYMSEIKRRRVYIKLLESTKAEGNSGVKMISLYFLYATMPIWIMFFALGVSSDKEVFEMIDLDGTSTDVVNMILATIRDADGMCEGFRRGGKARDFVNKLIKDAKFPPTESFDEYINKFLFPGITGLRQKALFLGYMIKCLLLSYMGKRKCDNKDDFRNKRLELAGKLLSRELWSHIRHAERRMVKAMQRDLNGDELQFTERYLDSSIITNGLNRAFSTGQWCHPYKRTERTAGIVATLRRTNPLQLISDLRKTRQSVLYAGKAGDARYPNPSYFGRLCFLSTPDGENCGLVKNLAITALVSSKLSETILEVLISCGMDKLEGAPLSSLSKRVKVLLNGEWIGVCRDAESFVSKFKRSRRGGQIHPQVEIKRDDHQKEVRIFTDAGRILRPLVIVENLKNVNKYKGGFASFQSLMDAKIIELIGVEEEEDCRTAWGVKYLFKKDDKQPIVNYTHCELDLSFLLALSCGIIPFANHNFARRVLYQAEKHSQQAIGFSTTNPDIRVDTLTHQMYYPQKPLFRTMTAECLGMSDYRFGKGHIVRPELFNGQNAIVAVNVHLGYNQEDSLVMNEASVQRGLFRTEHFRSYKADVDNKENSLRLKPKDKVDFGKMQSKRGRVDSLEDDGLPYVGAYLNSGDIVVGKVAESGEDHGVKLKHTEKGVVQKVLLSSNDEGKNFAVVTLRQVRSPRLGDKFSSMHGQKGVIGLLEHQENFPFTRQGIVPDIVINPHAFPTRQTPGQLLEAALGKGIACGGSTTYATPFSTPSVDVIYDQLQRSGFCRWGSEKVINGRTGELMQSMIFMGPTFYQRLIHMAEDKVKYRNTGPVHPLTRQPVADRKRFGGVKFGEMERDCLLAHGAAANLYERMFTLSDFSQMHICQICKRAANVIQRPVLGGRKIRGPYCVFCKSAENIVRINVPYGAKLLYQELFSMGICLKFETEV